MSKVVALPTGLTYSAIEECKAGIIRLYGSLWDVTTELTKILDEEMVEAKKYRADLITRQQYMDFLDGTVDRKTVLLERREEVKKRMDELRLRLKNTWGVEYE